MRTLAQDRDEMPTAAGKRWVARVRRERGIQPHEATCWFGDVEQNGDRDTVIIQPSPGDAIADAECRAAHAARRDGLGRWTLEVWGDGENTPRTLSVYPMLDEGGSS